jgi:hypothetical protein
VRGCSSVCAGRSGHQSASRWPGPSSADASPGETPTSSVSRAAIFANLESPYRRLLALAGCEEGDLGRLVRDTGLEGALGVLWRHGVYLTVDEFKGRQPVVRGRVSFEVHPSQLHPPHTVQHLLAPTGGSRSRGTIVPIDLGNIRDRAVNRRIQMDARGGGGWSMPSGAFPVGRR